MSMHVGTKITLKDFQAMKKLLTKRKMTSYKWIQEQIKKGLIEEPREENPKKALIKENNPKKERESGRDIRKTVKSNSCPYTGEEKEVSPSEEKEDKPKKRLIDIIADAKPKSKKKKYVKIMEKELQDLTDEFMKIAYPPK